MRVHAAERRVASGGRYFERVEHARLGRHVEIRHVGVPDRFAVAEAADRLAVHLDVGDDVDLRQALDEAAAGLLDRRPVEIAEAAAEGDQLLVAQRLAADQHHRMLVPGVHQASERRVVEVPEIDAPHLRAERCTRRDHVERARGATACGSRLCAQSHRFLLRSALASSFRSIALRQSPETAPYAPGALTDRRHCALMLDARITLAHFANSSFGVLDEFLRRARDRLEAEHRQALPDVRQRHDPDDLAMEESDDRFRRSGRNDDALPVVAHDVRIAGLRRRGQVRQRLRARLARHREAAQLALDHLLGGRRRRGEADRRMAPDRRADRQARAVERAHARGRGRATRRNVSPTRCPGVPVPGDA